MRSIHRYCAVLTALALMVLVLVPASSNATSEPSTPTTDQACTADEEPVVEGAP